MTEFVYYTDEDGFRRQVRAEDVDQVPDSWTPEAEMVEGTELVRPPAENLVGPRDVDLKQVPE